MRFAFVAAVSASLLFAPKRTSSLFETELGRSNWYLSQGFITPRTAFFPADASSIRPAIIESTVLRKSVLE